MRSFTYLLSLCFLSQIAFAQDDTQERADKLAHQFIIIDGHVDLPYRLKVSGFRLQKEYIKDIEIRMFKLQEASDRRNAQLLVNHKI